MSILYLLVHNHYAVAALPLYTPLCKTVLSGERLSCTKLVSKFDGYLLLVVSSCL